jgi:hypothetical protein
VLGDLTREPNLVGTDYDLITAFVIFVCRRKRP